MCYVLYVKIKNQQRKLTKSEEEYRQLFESNPNPLWIYNEKLRFVKVNKAAVEKYGYSTKKFLKMTVNDINSQADYIILKDYINEPHEEFQLAGIREHVKATGVTFIVSIVSYPVLFTNQHCNLVMATDITSLIEKERKLKDAYQKIKTSNEALLQIAWSNSHELRKPLCSILSLVSLLKEASDHEREEFLRLLEISSTELDLVLRQNNEKVDAIELEEVY
ncbi:PAS domain S-box protein [uncultured Mucilaginibacter sp.]|uniref:PAS domain S-box protein n=1 Tax=uncultured Mucilaginibacter sp. TaxID=797541 RepID=UPI0025EC98CF|nr:PAS domain S-box protein [uncultured Mucilaginibacter sp.]